MAMIMAGVCQGDERKRTVDEVSKTQDSIKTGGYQNSGISTGGASFGYTNGYRPNRPNGC